MIRIERTELRDVVRRLDRACFDAGETEDEADIARTRWWLAYDGDTPVAFAGARFLDAEPGVMMLERAGVLEPWRGRGLQLRLIRTRLRWAGERGADVTITYTMPESVASSNSLIHAGFKMYRPAWLFAGPEALYWRREP